MGNFFVSDENQSENMYFKGLFPIYTFFPFHGNSSIYTIGKRCLQYFMDQDIKCAIMYSYKELNTRLTKS